MTWSATRVTTAIPVLLASVLATSCGAGSADGTTGDPGTPPEISAFTATPTAISTGESSTLAWVVTGATSTWIDGGVGNVAGDRREVAPAATTTYRLTATNAAGSASATVTVNVAPGTSPPVVESFTATPGAVPAGTPARLAWSVRGATALSIDQGVGAVTGTVVDVVPAATTTYRLTATNAAGSASATATVTVTPSTSPPVVESFQATPDAITAGGAATLSWAVSGAVAISIDPDVGPVQGTSRTVRPAATTTYTLRATNTAGTTTRSQTVTVAAPGPVTVSEVYTHWLEDGSRQVVAGDVTSVVLDRPGDPLTYTATPGASAGEWVATLPPGPYRATVTHSDGWVLVSVVESGASTLDIGEDVAGPPRRDPVTLPTSLTLQLSGLQGWEPSVGTLEAQNWDSSSWMWTTADSIPAGTSSGSTDPVEWGYFSYNLLRPADTLWVTQMAPRSVPGAAAGDAFYGVAAAGSVSGIDMVDGTPLTVAVPTLAPPAGSGSLALRWKGSRFAAALSQPVDEWYGSALYVLAQPAPLQVTGASVDLLEVFPGSDADVDYGRVEYGRFLPASFHEYLWSWTGGMVLRTLPGTSLTRAIDVSTWRGDAIGAVPDELVPLTGQVTNVRVNGGDATLPMAGVGLAPTVTWEAPTVGSATFYAVSLWDFAAASGTMAAITPVAYFVQSSLSLEIPPGLLAVGRTYLLRIRAVHDPGSGTASPFRIRSDHWGVSTFISGTLQP